MGNLGSVLGFGGRWIGEERIRKRFAKVVGKKGGQESIIFLAKRNKEGDKWDGAIDLKP